MYLAKIKIENFKRFNEITIDLSNMLNPPKLVLLIGENGSGKSSIFDGFEWICSNGQGVMFYNKTNQRFTEFADEYYYKNKNKTPKVNIEFTNGKKLSQEGLNDNGWLNQENKNIFYGRSSLRQIPRLLRTRDNRIEFNLNDDSDRPLFYIDRDDRFENDIDYLTNIILEEVFANADFDSKKLNAEYLKPINDALSRIFGANQDISLSLYMLKPPMKDEIADIRFKKGSSEIHYNLLSNGEKAVVNLLFNLFVRTRIFKDTIYFIDELDLHLNTSLQYSLIKEITENWIPENCQFWTASHSLGFIQYATEVEHAAILDFDQLNFDIPQTLMPKAKDSFDVFEVAVSSEFLKNIFVGKNIYFSENSDTWFYNNLNISNTIFFKASDKIDVFHKSKNLKCYGLVDRDFLIDEELIEICKEYSQLRILKYYSLENYLYHPLNLEEYYSLKNIKFNKGEYISEIKICKDACKSDIIFAIDGARKGYPFYKETDKGLQKKQFEKNGKKVISIIESNEFEIFYKVLPMKDYCKSIPQRQNINRKELSATNWFKYQITELLK